MMSHSKYPTFMPALIVATAPCLQADLGRLPFIPQDVLAVNRAGIDYPQPISFWCTYHPEDMHREGWRIQRASRGYNSSYKIVGFQKYDKYPDMIAYHGPMYSGTSTLLALRFAMSRGYTPIFICGAPINKHHYIDYQTAWRHETPRLKEHGAIYSMSGWTKEFLSTCCSPYRSA